MRTTLALSLTLLAGCATGPAPLPAKPQREPAVPFVESDLRAAMDAGNGSIDGQAFARTVGGDVKYGAGARISLIALTAYTAECFDLLQTSNSGCYYNVSQFARGAVADADGRFQFKNLKPGKYRLETRITWGVPSRYGVQETGGNIVGYSTIAHDGEAVSLMLTP